MSVNVYTDQPRSTCGRRLWAALRGTTLLALAVAGSTAEFYVRPNGSAYGGGTGSDWNNAWSGFTPIDWSKVKPGDTIWVAGGDYPDTLIPNASGTSAAPIAIRRARADAPAATAAAGWKAAFDTTVHQTGKHDGIQLRGIVFDVGKSISNIVFSGRSAADGGNNGWWMDLVKPEPGKTAVYSMMGIGMSAASHTSNVTFEYMDIQGPGEVTYGDDAGRGIDITPENGTTSKLVFSHMRLFDLESAIYLAGNCHDTTFEYLDMYDIGPKNWSRWHPNGIWALASDVVVRYSKFHKGPKGLVMGEGIFITGWPEDLNKNWQIYGNEFYDFQGGWLKAIQINNAKSADIKIYNNTFSNIGVPAVYVTSGTPKPTGASEVRNNLVFGDKNNPPDLDVFGASGNNLKTQDSSVFANLAAKDFRIVATTGVGFPRNAGFNLSSVFTKDMLGNTFGADGAWDIGAYEYKSGGGGGGNTAPVVSGVAATLNTAKTSATLSASATDAEGDTMTYAWSMVSGPAAVTFTPVNAIASSVGFTTAGTYQLRLTATDTGGLSGSSTVTVDVAQKLTILDVSPATKNVAVGATASFAAAGSDQFTHGMSITPTWSVLAGGAGGTITTAGVYTAPAAAGTDTVQVAAGGKKATAIVTVTAAATFHAQVNFQPASAPAPGTDWLVDSGKVFSVQGGQQYGWSQDLSASSYTRDRNVAGVDQQHDTFLLVGRKTAGWKMAVPNGTYVVQVVMGDPLDTVMVNGNHYQCQIEGSPAIDGDANDTTNWLENPAGQQVTVTDGFLNLDFAGGSAVWNKIDFIIIDTAPAGNG